MKSLRLIVCILAILLCSLQTYSQPKQQKTTLFTQIKIGKSNLGKYNDNLPPIITPLNVDKIITLTVKGKNIPANLLSGTVDIYMIITKGKSSPEKIYQVPIQNNQISFTTRMLIDKVREEKSFDLNKADELLIEWPVMQNPSFEFGEKQRSVTLYLNLTNK
ncbi:MAG: hypothetical protein NZ455_03790 [Bacteroidia bacterium]|nr:hypothetical protein [Bacteroidia bacterium]MDW8347498.1 hypothetical protein [Bacteroidia bacterium]